MGWLTYFLFFLQVLPATITDIFDQIKGKRKVEVPSVQANCSAGKTLTTCNSGA
jgi:hypothetical protein